MVSNTIHAHRRRLFLFGLLFVLNMAFIFYMSGKTGSESQNLSDQFSGSILGEFLNRVLPMLTDNAKTSIRKYAHVFEFFCLGISSFLFFHELFWTKPARLVRSSLTAFGWSVLYACSDEWHQTFIPERSGKIFDLLFDGAGILLGVVLMTASAWSLRKRRNGGML